MNKPLRVIGPKGKPQTVRGPVATYLIERAKDAVLAVALVAVLAFITGTLVQLYANFF